MASRLFTPLKIGNVEVKHRIGLAPMTRMRATDDHVPTPIMVEYYSQRAAAPGTLIITEGTFITPWACGGFPRAPGIWNQEQITAWKTITDEVHRKECVIYCQLFAMGRAADIKLVQQEGLDFIAPSAVPINEGDEAPRAMTLAEIKQMAVDFKTAAQNALEAGFDGIEIHGANGYILDQFLQDNSNHRNDEYGGNIDNRSRALYETLQAVSEVTGPERVGLRLSPWSTFQAMKMTDPIPQFSDIITKARSLGIGYLHVVESRVDGSVDGNGRESLDFAYDLWPRLLLVAGGFHSAQFDKELVDGKLKDRDAIVIHGRSFLANPDLVFRLRENIDLSPANRATFYGGTAEGYTDYPFSSAYLASQKA